ncbi:MAG TPA: hypothetical protein VMV77_21325 [Bacteroidales bacterium]|nr:hypothetical protein [Bacteroidales bacterium]
MSAMIQGVTDLAPVSDLGGFDTKYVYTGKTAAVVGRSILLGESRKIRVKMACGKKRSFPAGVLAPNIMHAIQTIEVCSEYTEISANNIYIGTDGPK